jgi:hypothetical protein
MEDSFADDNLFPDETFKTDFERNSSLSSYFYDVTVIFNFCFYFVIKMGIIILNLVLKIESRAETSPIGKFYSPA